jgi:hypothetical protein
MQAGRKTLSTFIPATTLSPFPLVPFEFKPPFVLIRLSYSLNQKLSRMKKAAIALAFISFFVTGWSQNVGIGTITPAASAQLEVSSINKGFLTPRMTSIQMFQIASPDEGLIVYNTTLKKLFYFNGTEWRNLDGTILMDVGNYYQGGKIAYVLKLGDPGFIEGEIHGLIAAASDQSAQAEWGCYGTTIPGADGTALGTGNQNTIDIIAGCVTAGIAANI